MKKFKIHYYTVGADQEVLYSKEHVRLVLLTDLHGNSFGKGNVDLLHEIEHLKPDMIMMAGDMITAAKAPAPKCVSVLLCKLAEDYPVFYANGNHETFMKQNKDRKEKFYFYKYREQLKRSGIVFLENRYVKIKIKGLSANVYGLEAKAEYFKRFHSSKMKKEELVSCMGKPDKEAYTILLAHNPMDFPVYTDWGADLVLSGHLHGGFMRLPFLGGVISPQMHPFPKYDKGLYSLGKSKMIVSAGIGNHFPPPRLFNPRELVVIDLVVS